MSTPANADFWDHLLGALAAVVCLACALWFFGLLGYQCWHWLAYGQWLPIPTSIAFEYLQIDLTPVYAPESWFGLARVCRWLLDLPLSVTGPIAAVLLYALPHQLITDGR
ncbi:hypothetical protein ACLIJR_01965 [Hydrogenophaga sp. XSHU_21]